MMPRRRQAGRRRDGRAFTLVELVAVLAIVAIAAAIAAPRYTNSIVRYRAESAATRLAADLAYAQSRARTDSASRTVTFNTAGHSYTLLGETNPATRAATYVIGLRDEPYRSYIHSMDVGGDFQIVFNGYGMPDANGAIVLRAGSFKKAVEIDAVTGEIIVTDADSGFVTKMGGKGVSVSVN